MHHCAAWYMVCERRCEFFCGAAQAALYIYKMDLKKRKQQAHRSKKVAQAHSAREARDA